MQNLTDRQFEILTFLVDFTLKNNRQPILLEISKHFNISVEAVRNHFLLIEKKGYITYTGEGPRGIGIKKEAIELVKKGRNYDRKQERR